MLSPSLKVAALVRGNRDISVSFRLVRTFSVSPVSGFQFNRAAVIRQALLFATIENVRRLFCVRLLEEAHMKQTLAILATVATVGATAVTAPAQGLGPGLA